MTIIKKSKKENKQLKEYYANYYNGNYLRDYRYIFDDKKVNKYNDVLYKKNFGGSELKALSFLTRGIHLGVTGTLLNEIT